MFWGVCRGGVCRKTSRSVTNLCREMAAEACCKPYMSLIRSPLFIHQGLYAKGLKGPGFITLVNWHLFRGGETPRTAGCHTRDDLFCLMMIQGLAWYCTRSAKKLPKQTRPAQSHGDHTTHNGTKHLVGLGALYKPQSTPGSFRMGFRKPCAYFVSAGWTKKITQHLSSTPDTPRANPH